MNLTETGTEKDLDLAREYFEKAAALDNADALYGLGKLYLDPRFAGCSAPRAVDYLFAAAQKGHDYGQYALGRLFLAGEVVPKNPACADMVGKSGKAGKIRRRNTCWGKPCCLVKMRRRIWRGEKRC